MDIIPTIQKIVYVHVLTKFMTLIMQWVINNSHSNDNDNVAGGGRGTSPTHFTPEL